MTRLERFHQLKNHPYLCKDYSRLSAKDLLFCLDFLEETKDLNDDEYVFKVNRINYKGTLVWALLSQSIEVKIRRNRG